MVQDVKCVPWSERAKFTPASDEPALLKGWACEWPAMSKWTMEYLENEFGDEVVPVSNYVSSLHLKPLEKPRVKLKEYVRFLREGSSSNPVLTQHCYLAGWHFMRTSSRLLQDIVVPDCFRDNILNQVDRPIFPYDSMSFFLGHKDVESPLHTDSFGVSVWLANVVGRKTIRIVPPVDYESVKNGMNVFSEDTVAFLENKGIPILEANLEAGDIVFVPPGHWHHVKNHGITMAISVNFVNRYHFMPFEQQLRAKLVAPYLKLMELKARVIKGAGRGDFSFDSARHFNLVANEAKFLDFLERRCTEDRRCLAQLFGEVPDAAARD